MKKTQIIKDYLNDLSANDLLDITVGGKSEYISRMVQELNECGLLDQFILENNLVELSNDYEPETLKDIE